MSPVCRFRPIGASGLAKYRYILLVAYHGAGHSEAAFQAHNILDLGPIQSLLTSRFQRASTISYLYSFCIISTHIKTEIGFLHTQFVASH